MRNSQRLHRPLQIAVRASHQYLHTAEVSHRPFLTAVLYPAALWRIAVSAVGVHRPHLRSDVWLAFRDRRFASWCDLDPGCVWSGGVDR